MSTEPRTYSGPWGTITELPPAPAREGMPEQEATLSHWFLHAPPAHPIWPQYLFFLVHLRDVEGQSRPPVRPHPDDTHNIMLAALNPEHGPWTAENVTTKMLDPHRTWAAILSPLNVSAFVREATDEQARELMAVLARGLVGGHVPIEPSDYRGGRAWWDTVIAATMEHVRHGKHATIDDLLAGGAHGGA